MSLQEQNETKTIAEKESSGLGLTHIVRDSHLFPLSETNILAIMLEFKKSKLN
jgi:hypothetical protein